MELSLSTEDRLAGIIKEARDGNDAPGTPEQLIADHYRSNADRERREALGLKPMMSSLALIMGANTRAARFRWSPRAASHSPMRPIAGT